MPFEPLGEAEVVERGEGRVRLRAGTTTVEVTALAPDLYRVGVFPEGKPPDYRSEAIAHEYAAGGELPEIALAPLRVGGDAFELETGIPLHGVADLLGPRLRLIRPRGEGERYFGCGERTSGLEKTGSHQIFWNIDPPAGPHGVLQQPLHLDPVHAVAPGRAGERVLPRQRRARGARPGQGRPEPTHRRLPRDARLLRVHRRDPGGRARALHGAHRPHAACRRCGRWATSSRAGATRPPTTSARSPASSAPAASRATSSTSTSTTWTATGCSPGTRSASRTRRGCAPSWPRTASSS